MMSRTRSDAGKTFMHIILNGARAALMYTQTISKDKPFMYT